MAVSAGLTLAFVAYETLRIRRFQRNGVELVALAGHFPRSYTAGRGPDRFYVSLGDSTAVGVGCVRVEESLPYLVASELPFHSAVTSLAVSGARVEDVVREQLPRFPHRPGAFVLLSISANDATHNTDSVAFERQLDGLLKALEDRKAAQVVLTTTPNFRTSPALPLVLNLLFARRAAALTVVIERVAVRYPFVRLADLYRLGTLPENEFADDGFHPSPAGYRRWAAIFLASAR